jgi:hypothetical protein
MPRILIDPNNATCPDYTLDKFVTVRAPFVTPQTTQADAAAILTNVWATNNAVDIIEWENQIAADLQLQRQNRDDEEEILRLQNIELIKERDEAKKEEMKRHRTKFIPIPARGVPCEAPVIASLYATRRMDKGDFVPLWYYTNKGLEDALVAYATADDESLTLLRQDDGSTSLGTAASSKDSKNAVDDSDISWEDFCIAGPRMIEAMGRADWPPERIRMMAVFWGHLQTHPFRSSKDTLDQKALLLYQGEQRRLWHIAINAPNSGYDLSVINEDLLRATKERLFWLERNRKGRESERVRTPSLPYQSNLTPPTHISVPYLTPPSIPVHPTHATPFAGGLVNVCRTFLLADSSMHACHAFCGLTRQWMHAAFFARCMPPFARCMPFFAPLRLLGTMPCWIHARLLFHALSSSLSLNLICRTGVMGLPGLSLRATWTTAVVQPRHVVAVQGLLDGTGGSTDPSRRIIASRIFPMAQAGRSIPRAPFAWAATSTISTTATASRFGTGPTHQSQKEPKATSCSDWTIHPYAWTGKGFGAVQADVTTADTSVQDVATPHMEPSRVLELRRRRALTPYKPDAWADLLKDAGLLAKYPHIVDGLRFGFKIDLPQITITQTPPNRPSIFENSDAFHKIIDNEFDKLRYIGPLNKNQVEDLIGPFQSSPFSIIPKPGRPGLFRILQNYSFPLIPSLLFPNPSVNSLVDATKFPTTWGTFNTVSLLLRRLPPGSQIGTRDVAEAYRTVPLHESQWPASVARVGEDSFGIDTTTCFGVSPSSGVYGDVRTAGMDIIRYKGIGPISAWVDDHLFVRILRIYLDSYNRQRMEWHAEIRSRGRHHDGGRIWFGGKTFADGTIEEFDEDCTFACKDLSANSSRSKTDAEFCYNFDDIDHVSQKLGIPWEKSKDLPFDSSTIYIGFIWDISLLTVSLSQSKKDKYLGEIKEWQSRAKHTLNDVQKLYGKLLHTCHVIPMGRAFLTELEAMLGIYHNSPFLPRSPAKGIAADLDWWVPILQRQSLSRSIPGPVRLLDFGAFSDASSGVGIAIVVRGRWRAWRLIPGWQTLDGQRDIGWAEAIGFECLVRMLCSLDDGRQNYLAHGDNNGVVEGWWNGRSRNRAINRVFRRIHFLLSERPMGDRVHTVYVKSERNPADGPSRGIYPSDSLLLPPLTLPQCLIPFLIDARAPLSPLEERLRREGNYPAALDKRIDNPYQRTNASSIFNAIHLSDDIPSPVSNDAN